jgi:hypothetical protein
VKNSVFWMLRHVALVRTDVSEELRAFIIRVTRIGELGTTLAVTGNRRKYFFAAVTLRRRQSSLIFYQILKYSDALQ